MSLDAWACISSGAVPKSETTEIQIAWMLVFLNLSLAFTKPNGKIAI